MSPLFSAAPASAAGVCDPYRNATYMAAWNAMYSKGVRGLDADGDGYPCEHLAKTTDVLGETDPACFDDRVGPFPLNCSGQRLFRQVHWLTRDTGTAQLTNAALHGALVAVFSPVVEKAGPSLRPNLMTLMGEASYGIWSGQAGAVCVRDELKRTVHTLVRAEKIADGFEDLYGAAAKVASSYAKNAKYATIKFAPKNGLARNLGGNLVLAYLEATKKAAVMSTKAGTQLAVRKHLEFVAGC